MIIVVEGIDRVGKTTLCNKIKEMTGYEIFKHSGEFDYRRMDNENETDKMLQMLEIAEIGKANIIFDRFHFSDFCYGTIERDYNILAALENLYRINKELKRLKAIIVYVKPTDLKESSSQHGKNLTRYSLAFEYCYKIFDGEKISCTFDEIDRAASVVAYHSGNN